MANEITSLRKAGQIDQGIALGEQRLASQQADIWDRRGLFWCYYDKTKQLIASKSIDHAKQIIQKMDYLVETLDNDELALSNLQRIKRLAMPEFEIISQANDLSKEPGKESEAYNLIHTLFDTAHESLHEDMGWILYRYIKTQSDSLPSVDVRRLLAKYIRLRNIRPSMLHSQILQLALSFVKNNADFIFYRFFELWDPTNLRKEDYKPSYRDGQSYNPFIERIISQLADSNAPYTPEELHGKLDGNLICLAKVVAIYRERWFWRLHNISKSGNKAELWSSLQAYAQSFGKYVPDEFHSKILSLAIFNAKDSFQSNLIPFTIAWGVENLRVEDWKLEKGKDGNDYPSMASRLLSSVYDWFKVESNRTFDNLSAFVDLFAQGSRRLTDDHWPKYRYAKVLLWMGNKTEALSILKSLSSILSPQSYYWQDLASAVDDADTKCNLVLKAISLQSDENFLGTARLDAAKLLIELGEIGHAKAELTLYENYRKSVGRNLNEAFYPLWDIVKDCDCDVKAHINFVKERCDRAEEVLFEDLPWQDFVIADFWKREDGKEFIFLINVDSESIRIPKNKFKSIRKCKRGDIVSIRINRQPTKPVAVMAKPSSIERWGILPEKFGVVAYRNEENAAYVYMPDYDKPIKIDNANSRLMAGVGVKFRLLKKLQGDKIHLSAESIWALTDNSWKGQFPSASVAIDNVNNEMKLYHFVGLNHLDGIIRFKDVNAEYKVGDCLEITYFKKTNKDGKTVIEIIDLKDMDEPLPQLVKRIRGKISIPTDRYGQEKNFGFVENCFISPDLLGFASDGDDAHGRAIITKEGKWRVFELDVLDDGGG